MHNRETTLRTLSMLKTAMGPLIANALTDPSVIEIMVNPDGRLWIERHGEGRTQASSGLSAEQAERVVRLVASHLGREANSSQPIVSAELPGGGERFEGVLPPVSQRPCFSIRKAAARVFTLDDYVDAGILSRAGALALRQAVQSKLNIMIVGGTSSGKTTLANALLHEIADLGDRVVILEDTRELQCAAPDHVALRTQAGSVSLSDLVRSTLRLRPDRIIIGEVRGPEALDLLKAWNTGHPGGIATIHANSALGGLHRLEQLIGEKSLRIPDVLIAEAVDLVVFISGRNAARKVETIAQLRGHDGEDYVLSDFAPQGPKLIQLNGDTA
ncbi:MAG: P-type conjugative transfer ATPase TrbB [Pseudomonadota bacterium]